MSGSGLGGLPGPPGSGHSPPAHGAGCGVVEAAAPSPDQREGVAGPAGARPASTAPSPMPGGRKADEGAARRRRSRSTPGSNQPALSCPVGDSPASSDRSSSMAAPTGMGSTRVPAGSRRTSRRLPPTDRRERRPVGGRSRRLGRRRAPPLLPGDRRPRADPRSLLAGRWSSRRSARVVHRATSDRARPATPRSRTTATAAADTVNAAKPVNPVNGPDASTRKPSETRITAMVRYPTR